MPLRLWNGLILRHQEIAKDRSAFDIFRGQWKHVDRQDDMIYEKYSFLQEFFIFYEILSWLINVEAFLRMVLALVEECWKYLY